ncbi:MFS transporter [Wohlfahrtiimonas populi]|uniref:MFS transporter n=1 Tax=Wohlfahrtiimonas populi TaxID=1940240 RepID=UPI00098D612C|nr:MFS transporter [Wohlfahrtiimonas populi]
MGLPTIHRILTLAIPLLNTFSQVLWVRLVTGLFGGVSLNVAMAVLLDSTPEDARGKVIAIVLLAFPMVSIIGLPLMLWLTNTFSWHIAFYILGILCIICCGLVYCLIPQNQANIDTQYKSYLPKGLISQRILLGAASTGLSNFSSLMLIPLLVPIFTDILYLSTQDLPWLFLVGGLGALLGTKFASWLHDQFSFKTLMLWSTAILMISMAYLLLMRENSLWFAYSFMFGMMFMVYVRLILIAIWSANIPKPEQRGGFNSLQSALNNLFSSIAFIIPSIWFSNTALNQQDLMPIIYLAVFANLILLPCLKMTKEKSTQR